MTKQINLSKNFVTFVDDIDFEMLSQHKWYLNSYGYAVRNQQNTLKRVTVFLHREILLAPKGMEVDHINGDKLDNRRCNLRLATTSQNQQNRKVGKNNISGYKGVSWDNAQQKWQAQIRVCFKTKFIGRFNDPVKAAQAYDKVARELHGEFAKTNFV